MMQYSLIVQVVIIVIAGAIGLFYIRPQFTEISMLQDDLSELEQAIKQVSDVNQELARKLGEVNNIPNNNRTALTRYLPNQLDEVAVLKDLQTITSLSSVTLESVSYDGSVTAAASDASLIPHHFSLSVSGEYTDLKRFLGNLEQNNYPLHVAELSLSGATNNDTGSASQLSMNLVLETYQLASDSSLEQ